MAMKKTPARRAKLSKRTPRGLAPRTTKVLVRPKSALGTRAKLQSLARARIEEILEAARSIHAVRRLGPGERLAAMWRVEVELVSGPVMKGLNSHYRGKDHATDVLSFSSPPVFYRAGHLGELVICVPVLQKQALELKHPNEVELDVLLVHGVLHLLGLDHEHGVQEAREMEKLEARVLRRLGRKPASALIGRGRSGKS